MIYVTKQADQFNDSTGQAGAFELPLTESLIDDLSLHLFTALGATDSVSYREAVPGIIDVISAHARIAHGTCVCHEQKKCRN